MQCAGSMPGPGVLDISIVKAGPGWLRGQFQLHPIQIPFIIMLSPRIVGMSLFRCACKPMLPVVDGSEALGRGTVLPDDVVYGAVIVEFGPPPIPVTATGPAKGDVGSKKPVTIAITRNIRVIMASSSVSSLTTKR